MGRNRDDAMSALPKDQLPKRPMTVDQFVAWSESAPGEYELEDGEVIPVRAERVRHADTKFAVQTELKRAIGAAGVSCRMLPDGIRVRCDVATYFKPDALVVCNVELDPDATEISSPTIVIEVASPSTGWRDETTKLLAYGQLPSVMHYIIVNPFRRICVHFARKEGNTFLTRIMAEGTIDLSPPGITVEISTFFE